MKIQKVEIKNFKALADVKTELNGHNVFLVAPNCSGKTTFIDACFGVMPKQPLKNGEKKGSVSVDLGEYVVEFKFSERSQKPKMNIFDKTGKPQKTPAKLFKELFGITDFDIDSFLNLPAKKQIEVIKEIIGIDWSDVDARFKELYAERTFKTRQAKEIDGEIADRPFNLMTPVDVDDLQENLVSAMKTNSDIDRITQGVNDAKSKLNSVQMEIVKLKAEADELTVKIDKGDEWLKGRSKTDVSELQTSISNAADHNAEVAANEKIGELREKSGVIWDEIEAIETEMNGITKTKKDELENSVMPVKGLEFDDDQLYLDGLPFNSDQINTARRITAGLELQFQMMKDVKIARLDGSLLDKKSMSAVEKWADERGIQLFVELVDRDGDELKIEVSEDTKDPQYLVGGKFTHESEGLTVSGRGTIRKEYKVISIDGETANCQILSDNTVMNLIDGAMAKIPLNRCQNIA